MADFLVLKIEYNGTLRRFTLPKSPEPSFASLDKKIRELFGFPQQASLTMNYTDSEGDVVTFSGEDDLRDAVTFQKLNPLRLTVKMVGGASSPQADEKPTQENSFPKTASEGSAKIPKVDVNAEKIQEALEEKLKAAFAEAENMTSAFLSVAPRAINEVVEAALKSGFAAACEASFSMPEQKTTEGTSNHKSPKGAVPEATKQTDGGNNGEKNSSKEGSKTKDGETVPERAFHPGVVCDICGMSPIVGPRYRSMIKDDYDLCGGCYEKHGVAGDYNKMDRPSFRFRHPFAPNPGRVGMNAHPFGLGPHVMFGGRPFHMGRGGACSRFDNLNPDRKLDSRFVKDVTIFDGTEFAPGAHFTKIWRLRNDGSMAWPCDTRLVHVGGDRLGADDTVSVPVPEAQPGEEVQASVDLIAPEQPGRYVGHWRLVTPGGRKFGHRVWVLIQVVPTDEQSPQVAKSVEDAANKSESGASTQAASLGETKAEEAVPDACPPAATVTDPSSVEDNTTTVKEVPHENVNEQKDVASVDIDSTSVNPTVLDSSQEVATESSEEATSVGGFALVNCPRTESSTSNVNDSHVTVTVPVAGQDVVSDERQENVEENIVFANKSNTGVERNEPVNVESEKDENDMVIQQLKAMGFSDWQLNDELLKKHNKDFARVLDDLIGGAKWDPLLEELKDMGFYDGDLNRRLMFKHDGSVKKVIKELVQLYKQQSE